MTKLLKSTIKAGMRSSINGASNKIVPLVFKNLHTELGDQLITQSGDTLGGDV